MLELRNITKIYAEGSFKRVEALNNVTLAFRESEFVSVLGPSGCGKSTLLNIIGGLDRYTSGELTVDGINTADFTERDWDTYRNRKIGFVFQSYNLIAHQTVLQNVELALTLSGVSAIARKRLAMNALEKVGLANHLHKKPNELSGGEMQRVAIARAIVNDPEIILADEPTGALDSKTSIQIMELLKEISKEKLVIMVTHNDALASAYSTRIIKLLDSRILSDSAPYNPQMDKKPANKSINAKKTEKDAVEDMDEKLKLSPKKKHTSMSFWLSLSLSLKNLLTKKSRTTLTSLASAIGIVGLALVLALFNGLNTFINKVQYETLSAYPMYISSSAETDITEYISIITEDTNYLSDPSMKDRIYVSHLVTRLNSAKITNKITPEFQEYIRNMPEEYGKITYTYGTKMNIFKKKVFFNAQDNSNNTVYAENVEVPASNYFKEIPADKDYVLSQYDLVAGTYPQKSNELCLVLDKNNRISDAVLLAFLMDINATAVDEKGNFIVNSYEYDKFLGELNADGTRKESSYGTFTVALNSGYYIDSDVNGIYEKQLTPLFNVQSFKDRYQTFYSQIEKGINAIGKKPNDIRCYTGSKEGAMDLKITAILRLKEDVTTGVMGAFPIGYTSELTEFVRTNAENSAVVKAQRDQNKYLVDEDKNTKCINVLNGAEIKNESEYVNALKALGYAELPTKVEFYANDFDSKEAIKQYIRDYNTNLPDDEKINVTDVVNSIIGIIETFVDIITYVLIALTAISLIVSAIMIAIITYVSVMERTKEIGILRSIGARKVDVMSVFNAETVIIGLISGVVGIIITLLVQIPLEAILHSYTGVASLVALSPLHALLLIGISVVVTLLSGMIPALMASKRDPVKALRSE